MKAYLAGPMRGHELYNYNAFEGAARMLRRSGVEVVSPHEQDIEQGWVIAERDETGNYFAKVELTDTFSMEAALKLDFGIILQSDVVVVLPGWRDSEGAQKEVALARQVGIPVNELVPTAGDSSWTLVDVTDEYAGPRGLVGEERITDPATGGQKGRKLARMELLPGDALRAVAEQFGRGAAKYEDRNWERGYAWSLSFGAMQRHAWAWWQGQEMDEDGFRHRDAMAWHALVLVAFALRGAGTDDRPGTVAR